MIVMNEFDIELRRLVAISFEKNNGITTNLSEFIWNKKEIQTKVNWGIRYFLKIKNAFFKDFVMEVQDIISEMYLVLNICLIEFDYKSKTCFASYFNSAVSRRIERIFTECKSMNTDFSTLSEESDVTELSYLCNPESNDGTTDFRQLLFEAGVSMEELVKASKTKNKEQKNKLINRILK